MLLTLYAERLCDKYIHHIHSVHNRFTFGQKHPDGGKVFF
jgi:hypothetical protein